MGGDCGRIDYCRDRLVLREGHRGVAGCRGGEVGPDGACRYRHPRGIRLLPGAADLAFHHREAEVAEGPLKMALICATFVGQS